MNTPGNDSWFDRLVDRFSNSRFFTISFILHVLLIAFFGGTVLVEVMQKPSDFTGGPHGFVAVPEHQPAPPRPDQGLPPGTTINVAPQPSQSAPPPIITTIGPSRLDFSGDLLPTPAGIPAIAPTMPSAPTAPQPGSTRLDASAAGQIGEFTKGWGTDTGGGVGTRQREFEFTAFIARYSGGNWDSVFRVRDGFPMGALPNLLEFMSKESRDKIKTNYRKVEPVALDSDKIFAPDPSRPGGAPFIFFTGSRDFVLTDKEVANLQRYIRSGGAIWGDSSVPGRGSAFDIAFRREMKRVMADKDKEFEPLDARDPLFAKAAYFQGVKEAPAGLNHYQEPVYVMRYFGEISIIYTANDYGDMWEFGVEQKDGKDWIVNINRNERGERIALEWDLYINSGIYVHNVNPNPPAASIMDTYKFGANMIIHLLTRWEDKLRGAARL